MHSDSMDGKIKKLIKIVNLDFSLLGKYTIS